MPGLPGRRPRQAGRPRALVPRATRSRWPPPPLPVRARDQHEVPPAGQGLLELFEGRPQPALDAVSLHRAADLSRDSESEARFLFRLVGTQERIQDEVARRHRPAPAVDSVEIPRAREAGAALHAPRGLRLRRKGACVPWHGDASESRGLPGSASLRGTRAGASSGGRSVERFASRIRPKEEAAPGDRSQYREGPEPSVKNVFGVSTIHSLERACGATKGRVIHIVEMNVDNWRLPANQPFFRENSRPRRPL
jgi:hypothetical protein